MKDVSDDWSSAYIVNDFAICVKHMMNNLMFSF